MSQPSGSPETLVFRSPEYPNISNQIASAVLRQKPGWKWILGTVVGFLLVLLMLYSITVLLLLGPGVWGLNIPVAWGFAIVNFVWWIGIGHAGTFISAILLLMHQEWRTSINRFAEAMTLFAVACAGMFPLLHLGRPWLFYWLIPYPDYSQLWPQFRSPLMWDFFAVATYATVSLLFWYLGMIPDLALLRDRASGRIRRIIYGIFALGWRGSAYHWKRHQIAYLLLAGLATPLVISVHSIVGLDFAVAIVPGWHSTLFPPYFVAGAIFSGFAMVLTLGIPLRRFYRLENLITRDHLEKAAKLLLVTGLIVAYGYLMEWFMAWYADDSHGKALHEYRVTGPYAFRYYLLLFCNVLTPQALWFRRIRRAPAALFAISLIVQLGMWTERFIIVVTSLAHDYLPSAWHDYEGSVWDWTLLAGTIGFFALLFLLFIRLLPFISIFEVRELAHEEHGTGPIPEQKNSKERNR